MNSKIFTTAISFWVSFIKSFVPFFYFSFLYQERYHLDSDDFKYIDYSQKLLNYIITNLENGAEISLVYVWHPVTTLFFSISFLIYGNHYWAPIYLSVIFSCLTSLVIFNLFKSEISKNKARLFTLFYALGFYTIAWTSVVALREALSAFLTITFLGLSWGFVSKKIKLQFHTVGLFLVVLLILFNVRYYIPIFIVSSTLLYVTFFSLSNTAQNNLKSSHLSILTSILIIILFALLLLYLFDTVGGFPVEELYFISEIPYRFLSVTFGPIPAKLSPEYQFLALPAYFHIFVFPLSCLFIGEFLKHSKFNVYLFFNLLLALILFSIFGLNIRHRFQYEFIIYYVEFFAFYKLLKKRY